MQDYLSAIRRRIEDFDNNSVKVVDGYEFNQATTLRKIEMYYNSKFESGSFDSEGFRKFFYNIVHFPVDVAVKAIDIDTKDFRLIPDNPGASVPTMLLGKELKGWIRENNFGKTLNEIVADFPKYGTVVVKVMKDKIRVVNLHNLINDQAANSLKDSYCIERHVMTPKELRSMKKKGWDAGAIESVIELYHNDPLENDIIVYEVWDDFEDGKGGGSYGLKICAGVEKYEQDRDHVYELGQVLYEQDASEDDFPYREVHWEKVRGRWLGLGMVERNFDAQVRQNELANLKAKALYWSSKILFQTQDRTVAGNLLTDVVNGEVLRLNQEIQEVAIRNPDLGAFQQEEGRWDKNTQESSFSFEVESGQELPSGTPFRLGALLKGASGGFFNFKREQLGLFLRELFFETIIPTFKKARRSQHILTIPKNDKERDKLVEMFVEWEALSEVIKRPMLERANFDLKGFKDQARRALGETPFVDIPQNFYDNAKFFMELVITDEQMDTGQRLETLANLLQLVGSNPAILADPRMKNILFQVLNTAGVDPTELGLNDVQPEAAQQDLAELAQPTGSLPKVGGAGAPSPTPTTSTISG